MAHRDIIVIGASAGGVQALQEICAGLPANLNAAVLVVMHISPQSGSFLAPVLNRAGPLKALNPLNGERIEKGKIYLAPPNRHMLVERSRFRIIGGPRENLHRPAIDPTFRSAALAFGNRVIGIVLTGALTDGTSGAMVIRAHGGVILVQDPDTAMYPSMPNSILRMIPEARVATTAEIPQIIAQLVAEPIPYVVPSAHPQDESTAREVRIAELDMAEVENDLRNGKPSVFGCPDCGGVLWEIDQKGLLRFRCRVGHAYTADHLRAEQRFVVETALWAALRALEERASLYRRLAGRAAASGLSALEVFEERAATAEKNSHTLRDFLVNVNATSAEEEEAPESDAA